MACPHFYPTHRISSTVWPSDVRPPLGEVHEGECHARAGRTMHPSHDLLLSACNLGYAASACKHFPAGSIDAVRFAIQRDDAAQISVAYVLEQAHLPHEHGCLTYDCVRKTWSGAHGGFLLLRQAQAYLDSYLFWRDGRARHNQASA